MLLALTAAAGCAGPLNTDFFSGSRRHPPEKHAVDDASAPAAASEKPLTEEAAMAAILDELREIRAIDPEAERQLRADLEQTPPEQYPLVVETFRTALAYRRQLAQRETSSNDSTVADDSSHRHRVAARPASTEARGASQPREAPASSRRRDRREALEEDREAIAADATDDAPPRPVRLPNPPTEPTDFDAVADDGAPGRTPVSQSSYLAPSPTPDRWREDLERAIDGCERSLAAKPSSDTDLHAHMRLRALQLLAGQEEQAYAPIPGTSPAQQDYWSKQLFAMAAYLNGELQLDEKQRARAALAPLDEARARLSELASLEVRNLAVCESVEGYGSYVPRKGGAFRPGEHITLYAEIENFSSVSTETGYRTLLGASYRLVDETGKQVDANQFAEVADQCRNRRRDFHMQYGIPLPKQLPAGRYALELTVTDKSSGKIALATLPVDLAASR